MTIKPHASFEYNRADEIAECWDGVSRELYIALWKKIVPHQSEIPNIEDSGPADHVGHENLAAHWHRLSPDEQTALNELAAARDANEGCEAPGFDDHTRNDEYFRP